MKLCTQWKLNRVLRPTESHRPMHVPWISSTRTWPSRVQFCPLLDPLAPSASRHAPMGCLSDDIRLQNPDHENPNLEVSQNGQYFSAVIRSYSTEGTMQVKAASFIWEPQSSSQVQGTTTPPLLCRTKRKDTKKERTLRIHVTLKPGSDVYAVHICMHKCSL